MGWRLWSSGGNNNKVCVHIIDKFYAILNAREEGEVDPNGKLF